MGLAWIYAKLVFVYFVFVHFLKRPFRRGKSGEHEFLHYYLPEGLQPLSTVDKDWLSKFSQCLNCGYCDTACSALGQLSRDQFPGPSYLVTTFTRATPDFWAVNLDFSLCESCARCEWACPNRVPVKEALEFIEAKSAERRPVLRS